MKLLQNYTKADINHIDNVYNVIGIIYWILQFLRFKAVFVYGCPAFFMIKADV